MPADSDLPPIPPEALAAIREGRLVEAVRIVRDALGIDLRQAKQRVDAHAAAWKHRNAAASGSRDGSDAAFLQELGRLAWSGRKIEAIKQLRDAVPLGLKEAKDAVERIAAGESPGRVIGQARATPEPLPGGAPKRHGGAGGGGPATVQEARRGCAWIVVMVLLLALLALAYFLADRGG